jgi:DNA-binding NarL/FixJ family response regulator
MTVYIVDNDSKFRRRVKLYLSLDPRILIVGEAGDGECAVRETKKSRPDVVLMDIRLPGMNGLAAAKQIVCHSPETRVIMLTQYDLDEYRQAATECGVNGYVVKKNMIPQLIWTLWDQTG